MGLFLSCQLRWLAIERRVVTASQYAPAVKQAGIDLGISEKGIVIGFATVFVESNWVMYANEGDPNSLNFPHDALSTDANSDGLFQQRDPWWGTTRQRMDPYQSAVLFFVSLKAQRIGKQDYTTDATSPGGWAQMVQQSAFPDRYDQRMADAQALYDSLAGSTPAPEVPVTDPNKPAYNEFAIWDNNEESRAGTKVDLFLIHTQEGGGGDSAAEDLANFLKSTEGGANPVSYDYAISQASDGGVTLVDCVNTDDASWSVGNANLRSINLCFAGSSVNWSRDQWLQQANAIDVAAYKAVKDCKKYSISMLVVPPPYSAGTPGITDHKYVTDILGWGTHTDVGPNFPWDVFAAAVAKYANPLAPPVVPPVTPPVDPPAFVYPSTDDMVKQIWEQLFGPQATGFRALFGASSDGTRGKYTVEGVGDIHAKLLGAADLPKEGAL